LIPRVLPFKITQDHLQRDRSIRQQWLPINIP